MIHFKTLHKYFLQTTEQILKRCEASVLPVTAMTLPVIISFMGLATDASIWMGHKSKLQNAADAAVLAAGWEIALDTEEHMDFAAFKEATNNGYEANRNGELVLNIIEEVEDGFILSVRLSQDAETFFSRIIFRDNIRISAYAEAFASSDGGNFCVLALEEEAQGAMTTHGSVEVDSPECGIAVNSSDDEALVMRGNVDMQIGTVRISGDYYEGGSVDFEYDTLKTNTSPLTDPYEDLEVPDYNGCDENNMRVNSTASLSPGVYCGGLSISGNNYIEFEPGVYIIDGGDFDVTGSGELYGEGVTFILTGDGNRYSQLDISGSRDINFSAPTEGEDWAGITFFQDRDAPQRRNLQNKIVGTSDIIFNGVAYFPSQGLWFGGNATLSGMDSPCTRLIARTVTLAGNPRIGNNCADYDTETIGTPNVRLLR